MVSIELIFYLMIFLFGAIGAIRGWQKEVIAMAGLIGSIAFLHQFGFALIRYGRPLALFLASPENSNDIRQTFWIQFLFHVTIAFFSYQVIGRIAERAPGSRSERYRQGFQNMFIGFVIGVANGYLLFGTIWSFLEYRITETGYQLLGPNQGYGLGAMITRGSPGTIFVSNVVEYLPLSVFGPGVWLLFFFVSFFIVIIALV